jgi:hypothetical protein
MVVGDDPTSILQRRDLRREHRVVHERAVREHNHGPLSTVDDGPVDRHAYLTASDPAIAPYLFDNPMARP